MEVKVVSVSPEIAKEYLLRNKNNRPIDRSNVLYYAFEMLEGRWKLTSQTISVDVNGNLLNGQHRLLAVIESDTTQEFLIAYDEPTENFGLLDKGKVRSTADFFHYKNVNNYVTISAIVKSLYLINQRGYAGSVSDKSAKVDALFLYSIF